MTATVNMKALFNFVAFILMLYIIVIVHGEYNGEHRNLVIFDFELKFSWQKSV